MPAEPYCSWLAAGDMRRALLGQGFVEEQLAAMTDKSCSISIGAQAKLPLWRAGCPVMVLAWIW